ncbi:hypothetical protein P5W98_00725 [Paraburkholderia sp. A1BS-2L]|uniref:hypothetical protein n=1 Tax=Paraburkholderia sp. A1BS-2L TaxID=3028373 RepID=UPI003DA8E688
MKEISEWLEFQYPDEDRSDVRENVCFFTINDVNRRHYDRARKDFRTDRGNPKGALYKEKSQEKVTYVLYRPDEHGVWDIEADANGVFHAVKLGANAETSGAN